MSHARPGRIGLEANSWADCDPSATALVVWLMPKMTSPASATASKNMTALYISGCTPRSSRTRNNSHTAASATSKPAMHPSSRLGRLCPTSHIV